MSRLSNTGRIAAVVLAALVISSACAAHQADSFPTMCPFPEDLSYDVSTCSVALAGLWISLVLGFASAAVAVVFAAFLALGVRIASGWVDATVMRVVDGFFALPDVLVILIAHLVVVSFVGDDAVAVHPMAVMIASLAVVSWTGPARVLRDRLETVEQKDFVAAAVALGATRSRIVLVYLRPFLTERAVVLFFQRVPAVILAESIVSYIGVGNPDLVSLGRYLAVHGRELAYASALDHVVPAWLLLSVALLSVRVLASELGRSVSTVVKGGSRRNL